MPATQPLMILIAGPYRSGTNDDPALIAANVRAMTDMALRVFRLGHLPVMGEWFALPLIEHAGLSRPEATRLPCSSLRWQACLPAPGTNIRPSSPAA